jgi:hypothetical protein
LIACAKSSVAERPSAALVRSVSLMKVKIGGAGWSVKKTEEKRKEIYRDRMRKHIFSSLLVENKSKISLDTVYF